MSDILNISKLSVDSDLSESSFSEAIHGKVKGNGNSQSWTLIVNQDDAVTAGRLAGAYGIGSIIVMPEWAKMKDESWILVFEDDTARGSPGA